MPSLFFLKLLKYIKVTPVSGFPCLTVTEVQTSNSNMTMKMDVYEPSNPKNDLKHRPLTYFRIIRGAVCLVVILSTALMFLAYFVPVAAVLLRLFSVHYSRKAVCFLFGLWLALWPFLFEKINGTRVIFSGDVVPRGERALLIANHRTEVDWMYLWNLALRKGRHGYIKYLLKSSLMKLPIFGWGFHIFEFIPLERKWEIDEPVLRQRLAAHSDPKDPLWLAVFPEGTDYTEQKCKRSQKLAAENGLPVLNNVLLPKTKGFCACLEALRGSLDAVYDMTIAYKNKCPVFSDNVYGVDPSEVHIHIRRIPVNEIPYADKEAAAWLIDAFQRKDTMLSDFTAQGHFLNQGTEGELSTIKCLINVTLVIGVTGLFTYLAYLSFLVKLYIFLSCVYLTVATYFNFLPSPIWGSVKALLCRQKPKKVV